MTKTVEIYFDDLEPEVKERLLGEFETTEDQENWETFPLAVKKWNIKHKQKGDRK